MEFVLIIEENIQKSEYEGIFFCKGNWKKACVYGGKENVWIWFSLGSVIIISEAEFWVSN